MKFKQLALVGLPALALGLLIGNLWWNPTTRAYFDSDYWSSLGKVGEAMRLVHVRYVDEKKASFENLSEAAVSEVVNSLDKHSRYMTIEDFKEFELHSKRQFFGIGVLILQVESPDSGQSLKESDLGPTVVCLSSRIVITRVFAGGGAEAAGLQPGDRILAVGDQECGELSVSEISELISGDIGTKVSLVLEDENGSRREVRVLRGKVQMASVEDARMIDEVGYLRIDQFTGRTGEEFASALAHLQESDMRCLAIDLRDNTGGLLKAAVAVLGHFFEAGAPVVSIEGRGREGDLVYRSEGKGVGEFPVVVLINGGSASASEIVAGALQIVGKAKLVGESSYGKGSVQTIYSLDDGSGMRLTTARYFLPGGKAIGEDGLSPDLKITCDDETRRLLRLQRDQDPFADPELFEMRFGFAPVEDLQLQAALRLVKGEPVEQEERQEVESAEP